MEVGCRKGMGLGGSWRYIAGGAEEDAGGRKKEEEKEEKEDGLALGHQTARAPSSSHGIGRAERHVSSPWS